MSEPAAIGFSLDGTSTSLRALVREAWREGSAEAASEGRFPDARFTLQDLRAAILRVVHDELDDIADAHNVGLTISCLPAEILAGIFAWVPLRQRRPLALVCTRWQQVLSSSPEIWSDVQFDARKFRDRAALEAILALSKNRPLSLDLRIGSRCLAELCSALEENLHRCVKLVLNLSVTNTSNGRAIANRVAIALARPAPLLRSFSLLDSDGWFNSEEDSAIQLFQGEAPALHFLKLHCNLDAVQWSAAAFVNVTHLRFCPSRGLEEDDLAVIARLFPTVEELVIEVEHWNETAHRPPSSPRIRFPNTLRKLDFVPASTDAEPHRFLAAVDCTGVPSVSVAYRRAAFAPDQGPILRTICGLDATDEDTPGFTARVISLGSTTQSVQPEPPYAIFSMNLFLFDTEHDIYDLVRACATGPTSHPPTPGASVPPMRAVTGLGIGAILDSSVFTNCTRLLLSELAFDAEVFEQNLPPMLSVTHLTIYTMRPIAHGRAANCTAFVLCDVPPDCVETNNTNAVAEADSSSRTPRVLTCPALRTLRFAGRVPVPAYPTTTTPELICSFVERFLRYGDRRLDELTFAGVSFVVPEPVQLERMLALAERSDWDERHLCWRMQKREVWDLK